MCAAYRAKATNIIESASLPAKLDDIEDGYVKAAITGCNLVKASNKSASLLWQLLKMDDDEEEEDNENEDGEDVFLSAHNLLQQLILLGQ
jgi:hypothetical protein